MADFEPLVSRAFLGGMNQIIGGNTLMEITDIGLVAIAIPQRGRTALTKAFKAGYGCALPQPRKISKSKDNTTSFVSMQPDQILAVFDCETADAESQIEAKLGTAGYYTDQSDNWVCLSLTGPDARAALERVCMIDLDPSVFAIGASARSTIEHMNAVIIRGGADHYMLLSASSSASSFAHAIEQSLLWVT